MMVSGTLIVQVINGCKIPQKRKALHWCWDMIMPLHQDVVLHYSCSQWGFLNGRCSLVPQSWSKSTGFEQTLAGSTPRLPTRAAVQRARGVWTEDLGLCVHVRQVLPLAGSPSRSPDPPQNPSSSPPQVTVISMVICMFHLEVWVPTPVALCRGPANHSCSLRWPEGCMRWCGKYESFLLWMASTPTW